MAVVISVCNLKGGAGKSTIAVNLACGIWARHGHGCVLIDADRQGTAIAWASKGNLPVRVLPKVLQEGKPEERYPGMIWTVQIKEISEKYDYVIIDLPPSLQYSLAAVAAISDLVVVPVNPSGIDYHSTSMFVDLLQKSRELRGGGRPGCLIVPNRVDGRTMTARNLSSYKGFGEPVATPIHMRTDFARAFDTGEWIGGLAPDSIAHREIMKLVATIDDERALNISPISATATGGRKRHPAFAAGPDRL